MNIKLLKEEKISDSIEERIKELFNKFDYGYFEWDNEQTLIENIERGLRHFEYHIEDNYSFNDYSYSMSDSYCSNCDG